MDSPNITDRIDEEADAMASPADPHAVLDAIQDADANLQGLKSAKLPISDDEVS